MAVSIRLRREGARNRAFYRIVVADSRSRRDGRFIEIIGTYDPLVTGVNYRIDLEKAETWISKGARPSDTVRSIIKKARKNPEAVIDRSEPEPEPEPKPEAPAPAAETEVPDEPAPDAAPEELSTGAGDSTPVDESAENDSSGAEEGGEAASDEPETGGDDAEESTKDADA